MLTLLTTKLHRPAIPPKLIPRPHLIQHLNEGLAAARQIILVSAPAGFGKTTCVSAWVSVLDLPVAWLSLDALDDEPVRFFTYLIAALHQVERSLGQEIEGVLLAEQLPPNEIISATLINDILDWEGQFILVLDDFQVIQDRAILDVLETLVANLPQSLYLVLLTREDPALPLARLRANNQLTELRIGDLRFSHTDASRFLREVIGLSLSQDDITTLNDKTEGWVVGLQLAGLSMRDRDNPSEFIDTLSGSHRHIVSYLLEEVLSQQPEGIQQFLLQTSILDRLNGDLCNAVTERDDGHRLLEQILSANLFLLSLDDEQRWYRYHHLFSDLLRDLHIKRYGDSTAELHRRAAQWYAETGMAHEAIQHALAAKDYALAVRLIEDHAMDTIMQWRFKTVESWIEELPPEWISQSPPTIFAFVWAHLIRSEFAQISPYLQRLQAMFSDGEVRDPALRAEWLVLQAELLSAQGQPAQSLELVQQALEMVPKQASHVQGQAFLCLATAYEQMDDYDRAVEVYQMFIQHERAAGRLVSEISGMAGLAVMVLYHGQLHLAFQTALQALDRIERAGLSLPIISGVYGELGEVHYQWHQLEEARKYLSRSVQFSKLSGLSDADIYYQVFLSRLCEMEGDINAAASHIQSAIDRMETDAPARVREELIAQKVRVDLAQDNLASAETVLKAHGFVRQGNFDVPDLDPDQKITPQAGRLYFGALRVLLYRGQHEPSSLPHGIELANSLIAEMFRRGYIPLVVETLLLRAQMVAMLENAPASLEDYVRALELAEPEGFISLFLEAGSPAAEALATLLETNRLGTVNPDYVKRILAAFAERRSSGARTQESADRQTPAQAEGLTERERDVLHLIAEGLTYNEIASRLFVSLNTVRSHIKTIYSKLEVNNRTRAIEKAHQLRIL